MDVKTLTEGCASSFLNTHICCVVIILETLTRTAIRDSFTEACETVCQGSVIVPLLVEGIRADVQVVIGNEARWLQP